MSDPIGRGERWRAPSEPGPQLRDGSRIGIVGGGPAGSFFAYFLLELAGTLGRSIVVDLYEARDFSQPGPGGCNMCGGVVSESLVQMLAAEGIVLPDRVIQRGIDSYMLHTDVGSVRIATPRDEMRIGAVHRGSGPRDLPHSRWESFDGYLLSCAAARGAHVVPARVTGLEMREGMPHAVTAAGASPGYDLMAVAVGVNADSAALLEPMGIGYRPPRVARTAIREYLLGEEVLEQWLGHAMHVFLLDLPGLEFAAVIPKGAYATVCLLGPGVDKRLADRLMDTPQVRACLPSGFELPHRSCQCGPFLNVGARVRPFADRLVFLGDCGVTRLYKDGIGAAYRTAKVAATSALFHGVSAASFERHFLPAVRAIERDNRLGRLAFAITRFLQHHRVPRRGMVRMTADEQRRPAGSRRMSGILWDVFTGSAPYASVVVRALHPAFLARLLWSTLVANLGASAAATPGASRRRSGLEEARP